jgi:hypothetical protein
MTPKIVCNRSWWNDLASPPLYLQIEISHSTKAQMLMKSRRKWSLGSTQSILPLRFENGWEFPEIAVDLRPPSRSRLSVRSAFTGFIHVLPECADFKLQVATDWQLHNWWLDSIEVICIQAVGWNHSLTVYYCQQPKRRLAVVGGTSHLAVASPRQAAACTPRRCTLGAPAAVPQKILSSSAVMHTHIENMFRE